jgi:hypothetical protein
MTLGWSTLLAVAARNKPARGTDAVLGYVPGAVRWVDDDLELPLPDPGFAQRIEEITGT